MSAYKCVREIEREKREERDMKRRIKREEGSNVKRKGGKKRERYIDIAID